MGVRHSPDLLVKEKNVRVAPLQNEIAPKSLEFQNEKRNEKFEKRPETSPINVKPCSAAQN